MVVLEGGLMFGKGYTGIYVGGGAGGGVPVGVAGCVTHTRPVGSFSIQNDLIAPARKAIGM